MQVKALPTRLRYDSLPVHTDQTRFLESEAGNRAQPDIRCGVTLALMGSSYEKLAPIVRGWRNYHRYCKMDGSRFSLWHIQNRAFRVFNKESKQDRYTSKKLLEKAFPAVPYSENKHVNVKGDKSPFNGDIIYWSERNSKLYDGTTSQALKRQDHTCGYCGLKMLSNEKVHLHHVDGNHNNWKKNNLLAIHESCHDYIHMSKRKS